MAGSPLSAATHASRRRREDALLARAEAILLRRLQRSGRIDNPRQAERFLRLRQTAFRDPASYFHRYAKLSEEEARETALSIWRSQVLETRTQ